MKNPFARIRFSLSAASLAQLPPDRGIEVAFAGRSNAGKSSAINTITAQQKLARTSKTPGRTREINVFSLDASRRLVDLPGFGYARVSANVKNRWARALPQYLQSRASLRGIMLVMDIRRPLTEHDLTLLQWCVVSTTPVHVLLCKSDKLGYQRRAATLKQVEQAVEAFDTCVSVQLFSSLKRHGVERARLVLAGWLELPEAG